MKWVRFRLPGELAGEHYGFLEGDAIVRVDGLPWSQPTPTGERCPLAHAQLLAPVMPRTFYAAGVNYRRHLEHYLKSRGQPFVLPTQSDIGYRAVNALSAHEEPIVIPADSAGKIQFEAELVVVIGRQAKHLAPAEALSCVFGYTIGNDVSERAWQASDRTLWRAKNSDTFKPMGPWIETEVDLDAMVSVVRLDGREVSRFRTNDMIFGIADTIAAITRYITLYPGDVIWMGTDEPTLDMAAGDTVEVEIAGIGVLRNRVVGQAPAG